MFVYVFLAEVTVPRCLYLSTANHQFWRKFKNKKVFRSFPPFRLYPLNLQRQFATVKCIPTKQTCRQTNLTDASSAMSDRRTLSIDQPSIRERVHFTRRNPLNKHTFRAPRRYSYCFERKLGSQTRQARPRRYAFQIRHMTSAARICTRGIKEKKKPRKFSRAQLSALPPLRACANSF